LLQLNAGRQVLLPLGVGRRRPGLGAAARAAPGALPVGAHSGRPGILAPERAAVLALWAEVFQSARETQEQKQTNIDFEVIASENAGKTIKYLLSNIQVFKI
jgi:hypothetical protein